MDTDGSKVRLETDPALSSLSRGWIFDTKIMNVRTHYKSITMEMKAVKDRVQNVTEHWGEVGSWREVVLRNILRRHLPNSLGVGNGFVLTANGVTKQLDVIVYDENYPRYMQEGEFIIITADAVRAIVEVKSSTTSSPLSESLRELSNAANMIRQYTDREREQGGVRKPLWVGYFAYELNRTMSSTIGAHVQAACRLQQKGIIHAICAGESNFIRYKTNTEAQFENIPAQADTWRAYSIDNQAYGYFIANLIGNVCLDSVYFNHQYWFPHDGLGKGTSEEVGRLFD